MKIFKTALLIFTLAIFLYSSELTAQSTWMQIYTEMQTSCAGSSCHTPDPSNSNPLTLIGPADSIYTLIINADPVNPAAITRGNKIIFPCNPDSSFLLRKIACGRGSEPALSVAEGECMPDINQGGSLLDTSFVNLVRTWIAGCAPDTGIVSGINDVVLNTEVNIYPNPFSNTINVNYNLLRPSHVKLELISILGDKAVTFLDEAQAPGQYNWKFNTGSNALSPGIYILNVFFNDHYITRKITQVQ